jgi:hypothetical protein
MFVEMLKSQQLLQTPLISATIPSTKKVEHDIDDILN